MGGVLFHDAGNVFSRPGEINFRSSQREVVADGKVVGYDFDYLVQAAGLGPEATDGARDALARAGFPGRAIDSRRLVVEAAGERGVAALDSLRDAGVPVRSFELTRPTLEELFLSVVRGERSS
jgi:NADPH-dependent 2,4-dienoyl-CoA reductase/sulfur reductase-like enzyme